MHATSRTLNALVAHAKTLLLYELSKAVPGGVIAMGLRVRGAYPTECTRQNAGQLLAPRKPREPSTPVTTPIVQGAAVAAHKCCNQP
jgi:hypothetical protein